MELLYNSAPAYKRKILVELLLLYFTQSIQSENIEVYTHPMLKPVNLSTTLANVTEYTARGIMHLSGKGNNEQADNAAVECLRTELNKLNYAFKIVVGEGAKDNAPMLYEGETLGKYNYSSTNHNIDLLVDPLECTTNFANGLSDSLIVLLAASAGGIHPVPGSYMEQILVPSKLKLLLDKHGIEASVGTFLLATAEILELDISELCIAVQNRPRHADLIAKIRSTGAGVSLIESGSISTIIQILQSNQEEPPHILWGTYGAPEGIIAAFLAQIYDGGFIGRICPHDKDSENKAQTLNLVGKVLRASDLIATDSVLLLSGVHSSSWLPGVSNWRVGKQKYQSVHTACLSQEARQIYIHENGSLKETKPF